MFPSSVSRFTPMSFEAPCLASKLSIAQVRSTHSRNEPARRLAKMSGMPMQPRWEDEEGLLSQHLWRSIDSRCDLMFYRHSFSFTEVSSRRRCSRPPRLTDGYAGSYEHPFEGHTDTERACRIGERRNSTREHMFCRLATGHLLQLFGVPSP